MTVRTCRGDFTSTALLRESVRRNSAAANAINMPLIHPSVRVSYISASTLALVIYDVKRAAVTMCGVNASCSLAHLLLYSLELFDRLPRS